MNNEKVICKTECKYKKLVTIPLIILWISDILFFCPYYAPYSEGDGGKIVSFGIDTLFYGGTIAHVDKFAEHTYISMDWFGFGVMIIWAGLAFVIPVVIYLFNRYLANRCNLTVTDRQIYGNVNIMFTSKKLQMPLDKLDNIMTSNGIIDKCRGGETIIVSSNSGKIKFPYVYNATEFVNATLAAKEQYNANKVPQQNVVSEPVVPQSNADELKKYKDLLDNGVITQEEFEAKKKQLLGL